MTPREMAIAEFAFAIVTAMAGLKLRTISAIGASRGELPACQPISLESQGGCQQDGTIGPTGWKDKEETQLQSAYSEYKSHRRMRFSERASSQPTKGLRVPTRIREHRMTTRMATSWPSIQSATPVRIRATILFGAISNHIGRGTRLGCCRSFVGSCIPL